MTGQPADADRARIASVVFYAGIAFFSLLSRLIFSPLLIPIENDMGVSHAAAGRFFMYVSAGFAVAMLTSGFISVRISHRRTVLLSIFSTGVFLFFIALSGSLGLMRIGFFLLGVSCGFYLPSGMAAITDYVHHRHWGRAISIHELGYNSSFVFATLGSAALLDFLSWRHILVLVGVLTMLMGFVFSLFGKGGRFEGQTPSFRNVRRIVSNPSYWGIVILFSLSTGASMGVFSILPTYLVAEHGMQPGPVNVIVGLSRVSCLLLLFIVGWLFDTIGYRVLLLAIVSLTGILTVCIGYVHDAGLILSLFLQPMIVTCFFPIAFALLAQVVPRDLYNVSISLMIPITYFIGGGLVPAVLGFLGDYVSFSLGIIILGSVLAASTFIAFIIRREE
jgi:NNP family nitrate/nitrite transporter-like MFS transporter